MRPPAATSGTIPAGRPRTCRCPNPATMQSCGSRVWLSAPGGSVSAQFPARTEEEALMLRLKTEQAKIRADDHGAVVVAVFQPVLVKPHAGPVADQVELFRLVREPVADRKEGAFERSWAADTTPIERLCEFDRAANGSGIARGRSCPGCRCRAWACCANVPPSAPEFPFTSAEHDQTQHLRIQRRRAPAWLHPPPSGPSPASALYQTPTKA